MKNIKFSMFLVLAFCFILGSRVFAAGLYNDLPTSLNIDKEKVWTIQFNNAIDIKCINKDNLYIVDENNKKIDTTVSNGIKSNSISVKSNNNYIEGKSYYLIINSTLKDINGNNLKNSIRKKFSVVNTKKKSDKFKVCIDAGQEFSKIEGPTGVKASDVNLSVALKVGSILKQNGIDVVYTRLSNSVSWNSKNEVKERMAIAEKSKVDLFVSIHCNDYENKDVSGSETYCLNGDSKSNAVASHIQDILSKSTGTINRGVKEGDNPLLQSKNFTSTLVELGFISNSNEERLLNSEDFKSKSANAIAQGIINYSKNKAKPKVIPDSPKEKKESFNEEISNYKPQVKSGQFKVLVDPGHGGYDSGAPGVTGTLEKNITIEISKKLGEELNKNNVQVVYTRTSDSVSWPSNEGLDLRARCEIEYKEKPDCFICIHCNSCDYQSAKGIETYYYTTNPKSKRLAQLIQENLIRETKKVNRGIKERGFFVVKNTKSPSVLIEVGFISNPEDESFMKSSEGQDKYAKAISNAVIDFLNGR